MTVKELLETGEFEVLNTGANTDTTCCAPFCCDLLSIAMSSAPAGCVWCTVMANMNTLAVASLTECAVVILCNGLSMDENMTLKANTEGITVLQSSRPVFDTALSVYQKLHA